MTPSFTTDIWLGKNPDGWYHVLARCIWGTTERCREEMDRVLRGFADGRKAVIRRPVETGTETDFESGAIIHHGSVRFAFRTEPGDWEYVGGAFTEAFGLASVRADPNADVPSNENVL